MGKHRKQAADSDKLQIGFIPVAPAEQPNDDANEQYVERTLDAHTEKLISQQTSSALLYLLFYSILMFTLPFGAYFLTKHLLELHSHLPQFNITAWSVIASVVTIYIVIGLYAFHAYREKDVNIDKQGRVTYGESQVNANEETDSVKPKQKKI